VVGGRLAADVEAFGDLGVGQTVGDKVEDVLLAFGDQAEVLRSRAMRRAELAQERRGRVGVGGGTEPFEGCQGSRRLGDRELLSRLGEQPREFQPYACRVERPVEFGEVSQGAFEIFDRLLCT
jgi:hypothetical protein